MFWGLLRRRYKPTELVKIPAEMGGDCGIEGFSTDGIAYQCYADRDSLSLRARTDKQKSKLNTDTLKLKKRKDDLEKIFRPHSIVIDHYFLVVPQYHAVELVQHAAKRSEVVRSWKLSFIGPKFMIHIKVPEDYVAELRAARADGVAKTDLPQPDVSDAHTTLFVQEKPELVSTLETKLAHLDSVPANKTALRDALIRQFLAKEQLLSSLREWPDTWEAVESQRQLRQEQLELDNLLEGDLPDRRMKGLIEGYAEQLANKVPSLHEADATRIARGQVGDWLMRCPLSFKAPS
jgi:hypothetical protein